MRRPAQGLSRADKTSDTDSSKNTVEVARPKSRAIGAANIAGR